MNVIHAEHMPVIRSIVDEAESKIKEQTGLVIALIISESADESLIHAASSKTIGGCAAIWNISKEDLIGGSGIKGIVTMRQVVYLMLKAKHKIGLKVIGRIFDKNHTTVLHAVRKAALYLSQNDKLFLEYYNPVKHLLNEPE